MRRKAKSLKVQSSGSQEDHSFSEADIAAELLIRSPLPSCISLYQTHLRFLAMAAPQSGAALLTGLLALATLASCNTEGTTF
jgi:hypothetical protein